jgi:hypothetical protein
LDPLRLATSVVGGPRTGKTSLLRYLASPAADKHLSGLQYRLYVDMQALSSSSKPSDFWLKVFRGLKDRLPAGKQAQELEKRLASAPTRTIDLYDLEDVFDALSAVVFIDGWDFVLKNQNYWGDFFQVVRSMHQRQPRGVVFVVGSSRRLLDLWDDQMGSVYYNIFVSVTLGRMTEAEIASYVATALTSRKLPGNPLAEQAVRAASDGHPYLVTLITDVVTRQLQEKNAIDTGAIGALLQDPDGKVVELIRQIRAELSPTERLWLDTLRTAPQQVTAPQRAALERLRDYGLLPPGTRL